MRDLTWLIEGEPRTWAARQPWRDWVAQTASRALEFLILEDADGFVQTAAAGDGLTVEMRNNEVGAVWHVRFARSVPDPEARLPPEVPGYQGYRVAEVLSVEDTVAIFEHWIERREPHPGFIADDMLHELQ